MADDKPDLPSMRVVGESPSARQGAVADHEARERAIKELLREKRLSPADQAALDDHVHEFNARAMRRKLAAAIIIGVAALLYRVLT